MTGVRTIGLLTPGWPGQNTANGIATAVYNLALGLRDIGHKPVILAQHIDGSCPEDIAVVQVPDLAWSLWERLQSKLGDRGVVHRHLARQIAAATKTAVTSHGLEVLIMEESEGWSAMVQTQLSVPVITALHGPWLLHKDLGSLGASEDERRLRREQKAFESACAIIAPSRNVLEAVEAAVPLPNTPKAVVYNSYQAEPLATPAPQPEPDKILFVGRFDLHKGGDVMLEAMAHLVETHPKAHLTFVGPDHGVPQPDGSRMTQAEALEALPDAARARITCTGALDRQQVAALRQQHPIVVIASRYENLNYTLLEAMAAGQAIVSTAVGGPAEVLKDGETALLVPSEDPVRMAQAIGRLLRDPALANALTEAARNRLEKDFAREPIAAQTVDFVTTVIGKHGEKTQH